MIRMIREFKRILKMISGLKDQKDQGDLESDYWVKRLGGLERFQKD